MQRSDMDLVPDAKLPRRLKTEIEEDEGREDATGPFLSGRASNIRTAYGAIITRVLLVASNSTRRKCPSSLLAKP